MRYGTNETGTLTITNKENVLKINMTVGQPFGNVIIEIVNNSAKPTIINEVGEIRIKTPGMINKYLYNQEATQKAFKDGWFYPGDLAKITEDGQLVLMGRVDDMMIVNGINIYPLEIEQIVLSHPDILDVKALPINSKIYNHIPVCAVVLKKDSVLNQHQLLHYVAQKLGNHNLKKSHYFR